MTLPGTDYLSYIMRRLELVGGVNIKREFGGLGLYHRNILFGVVAFDEVYFKVDDKSLPEYQAATSSPLVFPGKHHPEMMDFWKVPSRIVEDDMLLVRWARHACAAAGGKK